MTLASSLKRACDPCHNLKEKCRRSDADTPCERCSRLNQPCRTTRQAAKTGRKPRCQQRLLYTIPNSTNSSFGDYITTPRNLLCGPSPYDGGLASNPVVFSTLDQWERHFLNLMKDILAPSPLDKFIVGPSFHESHHVSFIQSLIMPTPVLKHAAVACAAALFGDENDEYAKASLEIGHRRAALAISSLRSFQISNEQDVATLLILGVAMVTFAMHVSDGQASLISHYTLSLIKPLAHTMYTMHSSLIDYWMCLVCTETSECLLKSEVPSMRVDPCKRTHEVDRYLGLSSSIFAHLYDICEAGNSLKNASMATAANVMERLAFIKVAVEQWHTNPPSNFLDQYTQVEVVSMLSQAKIFRFAALLIIHRLQYPYGEQDREAYVLSRAIIDEFDMVLQIAQRSVPCTTLPYLAACFEIIVSDSRDAAVKKMKDIVTFSRQSRFLFEKTLSSVWEARDHGYHFHWFEIGRYAAIGAPGK